MTILNLNAEILWVFLNLAILLLLMKKFLFGPVTRMLDERSKEISDNIQGAQARMEEANQTKAEYEAHLLAAKKEAQAILDQARKQAQAQGEAYETVDLGNISFIWPCPSSRRITSAFGDRESPTEGASSNHKGVDIGAASGSDILAAAEGEVVISTYSYSAGNYIMIDHGGGVSTVYMHCSQLLADVGDSVSQGQVIAKVGSTGYSTGPHLHFGIRSGGSYVDPLNYVR